VALGNGSVASGQNSTAIGGAVASGSESIALGAGEASGSSSFGIGYFMTASGNNSTAMGNYVSTNGHTGAFIIGDKSTTTITNSGVDNRFTARFAGGYRLFTSSDLSTGVQALAGDNAWSTVSDIHLKENFEEVNGEDFLRKISNLHLTSWNYKKQNPNNFRHYGPMAQDFHAAFGKDNYGSIGNDTTINQADFLGVNFIAIQALEKRTTEFEMTKMNERMKKLENN
jgi:hypothetical protein